MSDVLNALVHADTALLIGAAVILLSLLLLALIARVRRRNPGLDAILDALTPWLYRAIIAGEKAALQGLHETDAILTGTDKAAIANSLYELLPPVIMVGTIPIPVAQIKALVPRYLFAEWVKDAYDSTHAFLLSNEHYLAWRINSLQSYIPTAPEPAESPTEQRAA